MSRSLDIQQAFIQDYGEAYHRFGLPRLMGHIIALLLYAGEPLSLDEISAQLRVSKGPVSQIARRLRDHNLIRKIWIPGSRKDHYQAEPDIFGQAFANHAQLLAQNHVLARKYQKWLHECEGGVPASFAGRIDEMTRFYELMRRHLEAFLQEWSSVRSAAIER